jgi:hypothetical protein
MIGRLPGVPEELDALEPHLGQGLDRTWIVPVTRAADGKQLDPNGERFAGGFGLDASRRCDSQCCGCSTGTEKFASSATHLTGLQGFEGLEA